MGTWGAEYRHRIVTSTRPDPSPLLCEGHRHFQSRRTAMTFQGVRGANDLVPKGAVTSLYGSRPGSGLGDRMNHYVLLMTLVVVCAGFLSGCVSPIRAGDQLPLGGGMSAATIPQPNCGGARFAVVETFELDHPGYPIESVNSTLNGMADRGFVLIAMTEVAGGDGSGHHYSMVFQCAR